MIHMEGSWLTRLVLTGLMTLLAMVAIACDRGAEITYVNNTPYELLIYDAKDRFVAELEPFDTNTGGEFKHLWTGRRVAKTRDGRVVFTIDLTWDQLKAQGYRIVIEEQAIPSPTAPTATPEASPVGQ